MAIGEIPSGAMLPRAGMVSTASRVAAFTRSV